MSLLDRIKTALGFKEQIKITPPATNAPVTQDVGIYISDAAENDFENDKFDRRIFAQRIAETIASKGDPSSIVVGIYGPWGDGKTTVLNFIENSLKSSNSVICFKFNPWRFEDETALLQTFFESLAELLKRRLSNNKEEAGKLLVKYGQLVSSGAKAAVTTVVSMGNPAPTLSVGDIGDVATHLGTIWSGTPLDEFHRRIDTILKAEKKQIVVMMDDIDRLDKNEIHAVLRLVKLTADFKYTAYVLAFEHDMVASAIGERYGGNPDAPSSAGARFLEKIVQVPLNLPPIAESALISFCYECINAVLSEQKLELSTSEQQLFVAHFQSAVVGKIRTPRMAKRYANALAFSMTMLKGEVHLGQLMLIEAMRLFYPEMHKSILANKDLVLGIGRYARGFSGISNAKEILTTFKTECLKDIDSKYKEQATELLETLFPRISHTSYSPDWEQQWTLQKRIASEAYFDRYFTYSIASTDVSDIKIAALVRDITDLSLQEASTRYANLFTPKNAGSIVAKLRQFENKVSSAAAANLAQVVSLTSDRLPNPDQFHSFATPLEQAAIFVSNMLRLISHEQEQQKITSSILSTQSSLSFACEVMRWSLASEKGEDGVFTKSTESTLKEELAQRIKVYLQHLTEPVYISDRDNALKYMSSLLWFGHEKEVQQYFKDALNSRPDSVFDFLRMTSPRTWDMTTGLRANPQLRREQFNTIGRYVDTELIASILKRKFGTDLDKPELYSSHERSSEETLAHEFMYMYQSALNESQNHIQKSTESIESIPNDADNEMESS